MKLTALKKFLENERNAFALSLKTADDLKEQLQDEMAQLSSSRWKKLIYSEKIRELQHSIFNLNLEAANQKARMNVIDKFLKNVTENGLVSPIPLYDALFCLHLAYKSTFHVKYLSKVFGMIVCEMGYLTKMEEFNHLRTGEIEGLNHYYNWDGNFERRCGVEPYWKYMNDILENALDDTPLGETSVVNDVDDLVSAFCDLHECFIQDSSVMNNCSMNIDTDLSSSEETQGVLPSNRLREYYSSYTLHKVPDDIDAFLELLDECKVDAQERKYIFSLIEKEREKEEAETLNSFLSDEDKMIYQDAVNRLNTMPNDSSSYDMLKSLVCGVQTIVKRYLAKDLSFKITQNNIHSYISYMPFWHNAVDTDNRFVLLKNDKENYFVQDVKQLERGKWLLFAEALEGLTIDIVKSSNKVMMEGIYPLYNVIYKDCSVFVLALPNDVFVVVGAAIFGYGENEMKERILANSMQLQNTLNETQSLIAKESVFLYNAGVISDAISTLRGNGMKKERKKAEGTK